MEMPPLAIFIGAMKAGTTTIYQMTSEHPQIAPSVNKEINFFCKGDREWNTMLDLFDYDPSRHRWLLDVSPNYSNKSLCSEAAERISQYPGEKVLFYILRDPVDRVNLHLAHSVKRGRWSMEDHDRLIGYMVDISRYSMQIDQYERSGLRPMLLDFDEIAANSQRFVDRITSALGIGRLACGRAPHRHRSIRIPHIFGEAEKASVWADLAEDVEILARRHGFGPARSWLGRWQVSPHRPRGRDAEARRS